MNRRKYLKGLGVVGVTSAAVGTAAASTMTGQESTTASLPTDESRPALYLHLDQLAAVKQQADAGNEPWASAYDQLIADANEALDAPALSVTDNDGDNTFSSGNPGSGTRGDYIAAIRMGDHIRDLGLAYQLTADDRYAVRAVELLDHWFLDPETRMAPVKTDGIELYITIPKMWFGAELVRNHPAWDRDDIGDQSALDTWTNEFLETIGTWVPQWIQNIFIWREGCRAAGGAYLDDQSIIDSAFQTIRDDGFAQLREDGLLANEITRYDGLGYSMYGLKAYITMAELGRHYGRDLYGYEKYGGSAIKLMFDGYVQYILNPETFDDQFGLGNGFTAREREEGTSAYELAYSYFEDPDYLDVITSRGSPIKYEPTFVEQHRDAINSRGRPVRDERLLGWTSFTHGNLFEIDASTPPQTPDTPETPSTTETPETTEPPGTTESPETPEPPGTTETPETPEPPETTESPETPETPEPPETPEEPEEQFLLIESEEVSPYRFAATGTIRFNENWGTEDTIRGSASGVLAGGGDKYRFMGSIVEFEIEGQAELTLDGMSVTAEELRSMDESSNPGDSDEHTLLIESEEVSPYQFTVTGSVEFDEDWGTEDTIRNSASGVLAGGGDGYFVSGDITMFEIDGPATIELDGEPVTVDELTPSSR